MTDVEFTVIRPRLKYVALPSSLSLHEPHRSYRFAHFPNDGLISLVIVMANGRSKPGSSGTKAWWAWRQSRVSTAALFVKSCKSAVTGSE